MVNLRVTVIDPARSGAAVDLRVTCDPGTTLASVTPQLLLAAGREVPDNACQTTPFSHEGVPVPGLWPVGTAPLLDGAVLLVRGATTEQVREPGLLAVHVVAGPDAGRIVSLPPGEHRIGRAPGCSVRLEDPDVSRAHAILRVGVDATTVTDLGSTYGTSLGAARLGPEPADLGLGQPVRIGSSVLVLRRPDVTPAAVTPDGAGHLLVNRCPRLGPGPGETVVEFPAEPDERPPAKLPWLVMLLPMVVSLVVAAVLRQPLFLLFALTTPALMAGQYLTERRTGRREKRDKAAAYASALAAAHGDLERELAADKARQEASWPDLALVARTAQVPAGDLWFRTAADPEHLQVRLGRGTAASTIRRAGPGTPRGGEPVAHQDIPIGLDLATHGVIGICGPGRSSLARSLLGQLATLQSPQDVAIEIVGAATGSAEWSFVRWLPHHPSGDGVDETATARVTVLDDAPRLRLAPGIAGLLAAAAKADRGRRREIVICLAEEAAQFPLECGATIELRPQDRPGEARPAVLRRASAPPQEFRPDLPGPVWAELIARALAPLRDATPQPGAVPECPALPDLLAEVDGVEAADPHALARHWSRDPSSPVATIGVGSAGPVRIDLRRDGPHALVGGTTGAGKSELLLSLVTALAADRGPDETSFLLVDYKGGAAFQACAGLPHVAGLITDLDPHLAGRALASLRAELRRRERVLASAGAVDLDAYRAAGLLSRGGPDAGRPPLPRLVVVVDEFRVLAEELPDFVSGLVRIAAVGRSLGVHLVLATQRPAGVVSAEIRANTALRIALRVRDAADSHDLIETADAAGIPAGSPGRGIARIGGELTSFQVSSVLAPRRTARPPSVRPLDASPEPQDRHDVAPGAPGELVAAMNDAAALLGLPPVQRPWLPPLPTRLPLRPVLETARPPEATSSGGPPVAVLGVADLPEAQRQEAVAWTASAGHLGVLGGPRSGRTTALLTIAHSLAAGYRADELHLYGIDATGALAGAGRDGTGLDGTGLDGTGPDSLARLPHCGAVVPAADTERSVRLLAWLRDLIDGQRQHCPVVLLVDGWESLTARWASVDHGILIEHLTAVLRDGGRHGIHVAVAGGRSLLTGQVSSLLSERLVLRFADPTDAVLAGVRNLGDQPPGRGVLVRTHDPDGCEIHVATTDFAIADDPDVDGGPWRLCPLPQQVPYGRVEVAEPGAAQPGLRVPLGLGGDSAGPVQLDLDRPGVTLIHGSPGSGRTTALAVIETGVRATGTALVRAHGCDPAELIGVLADDPDAVVLVDDVTRLSDPVLEQALVERARTRPDRPRIVVVAGPGEVVTAFRGLAAEARTSRYGLALGALGPADAGVLGLGSMSRPAGPPGRARLVDGAGSVPVQVALPTPVVQLQTDRSDRGR